LSDGSKVNLQDFKSHYRESQLSEGNEIQNV